MDQAKYEYKGWTFQRTEDGALTIEPRVQAQSGIEKQDFASQQNEQTLTIPAHELPRLAAYVLTGSVDQETVRQIESSLAGAVGSPSV